MLSLMVLDLKEVFFIKLNKKKKYVYKLIQSQVNKLLLHIIFILSGWSILFTFGLLNMDSK